MADYELKVVGKDENKENAYRVFQINGMNTIGVKKSEEFELVFKNNTNQKIQVRLSIDGTDVLTGELASTKPTGKMWVVNPYGSMNLKAWPENTSGGAQFIFGNLKDSVAKNTHGITVNRGIIAAAVYVEGQHYSIWSNWSTSGSWPRSNKPGLYDITLTSSKIGASSLSSHNISDDFSVNYMYDAGPAVGAGEFVEQKLATASGLLKPVLDDIVQIRYEWWDKLQKTLEKSPIIKQGEPNPFPADHVGIDLKKTPRMRGKKKILGTVSRFV